MFWSLFLLVFWPVGSSSQNFCGKGQPSQLATVAVWVKHNGSLSIFLISDEDLTDEGFQRFVNKSNKMSSRSPADRELYPVQLGRQPGSCPVGLCAFRLSASRRYRDSFVYFCLVKTPLGVLLQQEDVLDLPEGYESLNDDFYCGRGFGDCGADVPIYRLSRGKGPDAIPAYSMDPSATIPGFTRDPRPLCYGWSDGTGLRRPVSGDGCFHFPSIANGETASFAVGTTAMLHCSSGFLSSGIASSLCTKNGWNPPSFGSCIRSSSPPSSLPHSVTFVSSGSASRSSFCTAGATVKNGQILYSQLEIGGRLPTGTMASVLCYLGFISTSNTNPKCENGDWIGQWPMCVPADRVQCQPLPQPSPVTKSKLIYESSENPLAYGSVATLQCPSGSAIAGAVRSTCGRNGWQPKVLGMCVTAIRVKRQGLPCLPIGVFGGNVTYIQANPATLYAAGTSALIVCNIGYSIQGSGSSLCQNGQWIPSPGSCSFSSTGGTGINSGSVGAACLDFATPLSSTVTYSLPSAALGTHPSATVATLNCNLGTTVSGALSSTCSNGIWSPTSLGTCSQGGATGSQCLGGIIPPFGATVTYSTGSSFGPFSSGATATMTCSGGQIPTGAAFSTCLSGQWNPAAFGSCPTSGGGTTCTAPAIPSGGSISYSQVSTLGSYNQGTIATLLCTTGAVTGSTTSTCQSGSWSPPLGTCGGVSGTCFSIIPPMGTTITYSTGGPFGPFNQGATATVSCMDPTQQIIGSRTATCQSSTWTPSLTFTQCAPQGISTTQCPSGPTTPFGATITYSNGAIFGPFQGNTVATMTCTSGIVQATTTCVSGQWSPALGTCSSSGTGTIQCTSAAVVPVGGVVSYTGGQIFAPFTANTVATLTCTSGLVQGQSTTTCTNGQWSPALGICSTSGIGLSCNVGVTTPVGGSISYSNGGIFGPFPTGTVATLSCGTVLPTGSSTSTCSNGQWSQIGSCSNSGGTSCNVGITTPIGGSISYSNGGVFGPFPAGTVATLSCGTVFPTGSSTATCSNGQWTQLGSCLSSGGTSCNVGITTPIGGSVSYSNGAVFGPFPTGTVATLSCGATLPIGSSTSTCSNGQWTQLGSCSGGSSCSFAIATPTGATVTYSNGAIFAPFASGTVATLQCISGTPNGQTTSTCSNGQWNPSTLPTCSTTGSSCSPLALTFGSTISYSITSSIFSYPVGTIATLSCSSGFITGSSTSTCSNGVWQPTIGSCSTTGGGTQCSFAPATPPGGSLSYSSGNTVGPWNSGTVVTLTCPIGQYPQGSSTATCSNGSWGSLATSCSSTPIIANGCSPFAALSSQISSGTAIYNPSFYSNIPIGSSATLICNSGFISSGVTSSTCTTSGWQPNILGICIPGGGSTGGISCSAQATPIYGNISYSQAGPWGPFPSGTSAFLSCSNGYRVDGTSSTQCSNGQWIPSQFGACVSSGSTGGAQCFTGLTTSLGTVTYSNGQTFGPWNSGTTATLTCIPPNFFSSGASTSVCSNGQWTPSQLGICSSNGGVSLTSCQAIPFITGGTVTYSNFGVAPYSEGVSATLVCNFGTVLSGQSTVTCRSGGWTPFPGLGTCQTALHSPARFWTNSTGDDAGCLPPKAPPNGEITYSNPEEDGLFSLGTTASLRCFDGFEKRGATFSTCSLGQFRPLLGACDGNESSPVGICLPLQAGTNGKITYIQASSTTALEAGSTALLDCDDGFAVSGRATLSCDEKGSWQPENGFGMCELAIR